MRGIFRLDGPVYRAMTFIYYIIILNLLWIICSIPLVTIGASTTASFYVAGKFIRKEEVHEFRDFFKSFKMNFKQSTIAWLIISALFIIIYINVKNINLVGKVVPGLSIVIYIIQLIIGFQIAVITLYLFVLLSRYQFTIKNLFLSAWFIGNKHIFNSIFALITCCAIMFASYRFVPLLFFCSAGMISLCVYGILYRVIELYNPEKDKDNAQSLDTDASLDENDESIDEDFNLENK